MGKKYCGPFWFPKWLNKALSSRYNASCKVHDLDYDSGLFRRSEADSRFLEHMIRQDGKKTILSRIFYLGVRLGGWVSWWKARRDRD